MNNLRIEQTKIKNLYNSSSDSTNSIEILPDKNILISCTDQEIIAYNQSEQSKAFIYKSNNSNDEITYLKHFDLNNTDVLVALNDKSIFMFDLLSTKQIGKFKFSKDTVNCIDLNRNKNTLACGDDRGEIKLLDFRMNLDKANKVQIPSLTLKKNLAHHENICFALKYNPLNENELFSGSYDCTIIKYDIRFTKANAKKPFLNQISIPDTIKMIISDRNEDNSELDHLVSSMTPSFVHSLHFAEFKSENLLLSGTENGLCISFDPISCDYVSCKQLQPFNCALTQLLDYGNEADFFESGEQKVIIAGGDGKLIDFVYLNEIKTDQESIERKKFNINKFDAHRISHKDKINSIKCSSNKLYVADTSSSISIYNIVK
jgi:WD40 repeat protein